MACDMMFSSVIRSFVEHDSILSHHITLFWPTTAFFSCHTWAPFFQALSFLFAFPQSLYSLALHLCFGREPHYRRRNESSAGGVSNVIPARALGGHEYLREKQKKAAWTRFEFIQAVLFIRRSSIMTTVLFYRVHLPIANSATADLENGHTYGPFVSIHIDRFRSGGITTLIHKRLSWWTQRIIPIENFYPHLRLKRHLCQRPSLYRRLDRDERETPFFSCESRCGICFT